LFGISHTFPNSMHRMHQGREMNLRPPSDLIHSFRATLQKLEHTLSSPEDEHVLAEIKNTLLIRIADLEISEAAKPADGEPAEPLLQAVREVLLRAKGATQLDKLD
jgi:hypothetical protein